MIHIHESFQGGVDRLWAVIHAAVPTYLRGAMRRVGHSGIEFNTIPDSSVPAGVDLSWWDYVQFVSQVDEWAVTTGNLEIRIPQTRSVIHPDTPPGLVGSRDPEGFWEDTLQSDAYGKVCPHQSWALPARGTTRAVSTLELNGRHCGLIVVCNRGGGDLPSGAIAGPLTDQCIAYSFFHETALHAGTISYYRSGHPETPIDHPAVDSIDQLLRRVIPAPIIGFRVV